MPRPEYPRPEARREGWKNLNGRWDFEFDPDHVGMKEKWYEIANFSQQIQVPFVFQSVLSGIDSQEFIDTAWYSRTFTIETKNNGKNTLLHFGAVDYQCELFVNGTYVGTHQGGVTPFNFNITSYLIEENKKQLIVLRVFDPPFDPSIPRGKQSVETELKGIFYEKSLGIWQTVWLEFVPSAYISREDYYIRVNYNTGEMEVNITVKGEVKPDYVIEAEVFDGEESVSSVGYAMLDKKVFNEKINNPITFSIDLSKITRWSPNKNEAKLYDVHFRLIDGDSDEEEALDILICTYGFREVEFKDGKLHINGKPIYLKQALYQGYWTKGLWTAPSDELIQKDLDLTLEMGFNGLRPHQIVADPRFLHWADRKGILLFGEMANAYEGSIDAKNNLMNEWSSVVRRDRCHPSIIAWTPLNESWGTGDLNREENQQWLRSIYYWTKTLDPTRACIDNDGWEHVLTDIATLHKYSFAPEFAEQFPVEKPKDLGKFLSEVVPSKVAFVKGIKSRGEPVMLTEWGGWSLNIDGDGSDAWGYQGALYKSWEEIVALYKSFVDELEKRKDWICGHCYTEFNDQYQEMNGLLTFDRRPKGDLKKIKELNDRFL